MSKLVSTQELVLVTVTVLSNMLTAETQRKHSKSLMDMNFMAADCAWTGTWVWKRNVKWTKRVKDADHHVMTAVTVEVTVEDMAADMVEVMHHIHHVEVDTEVVMVVVTAEEGTVADMVVQEIEDTVEATVADTEVVHVADTVVEDMEVHMAVEEDIAVPHRQMVVDTEDAADLQEEDHTADHPHQAEDQRDPILALPLHAETQEHKANLQDVQDPVPQAHVKEKCNKHKLIDKVPLTMI